jgi:hypothetical protein
MVVVHESGKYVYCVIKSNGARKSFGNIGFGGTEVYSMDYRDLSPVVCDIPLKKYDVDDDDLSSHQSVVDTVMKDHSVLPVAYGMAFKNKKLLVIAMSAGYRAMMKAMKEVDDKVELGVKVLAPADSPKQKIEGMGKEIMDTLKAKAAQAKELKLFSDRLLFNASFLVDKNNIDGFSGEVERLVGDHPSLNIKYSGPWPPYNFVDIHILGKKLGGFR